MTENELNESRNMFDGMLEWLDDRDWDHDAWLVVEEAAALASEAKESPYDLHLAGRVYGMAEALRVMYDESCGTGYDPSHTQAWIAFIEDFAEDNYVNGERID